MDYREYLDKARLKQLAELQERYNQVYAKERAEAASGLRSSFNQYRRGLQNVGLASRKGKLISGREKTAALAARRQYRDYNTGLNRVSKGYGEAAGRRMANQVINEQNRTELADAYKKWGDDYAQQVAEAKAEYEAKLQEIEAQHLAYANEYQQNYDDYKAQLAAYQEYQQQLAQYQAWLQQQAAQQAAAQQEAAAQQAAAAQNQNARPVPNRLQGLMENTVSEYEGKTYYAPSKAQQQAALQKWQHAQAVARADAQNAAKAQYAAPGNRIIALKNDTVVMTKDQADAVKAAQAARQKAAESARQAQAAYQEYQELQAKIAAASKITEPRTSADIAALQEAQYAQNKLYSMQQEAKHQADVKAWNDAIKRAEGITKPTNRYENEALKEAAQAKQQWLKYEQEQAALRLPSEYRNLVTLSDSEFKLRYEAAEQAYKNAVQNAQILRKDSSSSMDDLSSDANDIEAKATSEFVKWQQAAAARADAQTAFYADSVQPDMTLAPHAPAWANKTAAENWKTAYQKIENNEWRAHDYDIKNAQNGNRTVSKYAALVNDWSFISGDMKELYSFRGSVDNFFRDIAEAGESVASLFDSNGLKISSQNAYKHFLNQCTNWFYNLHGQAASAQQKDQMTAMLALANIMTDEERARFNTILKTHGRDEADKYFEFLYTSVLPGRMQQKVDLDYDALLRRESIFDENGNRIGAKDGKDTWLGKAAMSVWSVPGNIMQGASSPIRTLGLRQNDITAANLGAMHGNTAQGMREAVQENFSNAGRYWYGTGMSMADSATVAAIGGAIGGVLKGIGIAANVASKIGSVISGAILGGSAFNAAYQESLERGLTPEKARITAAGEGFNEMLFESLSIDLLFEQFRQGGMVKISKKALPNWGFNTFLSMIAEGSEEVVTDKANDWWDKKINPILNKEIQQIMDYMNNGYSYEDAKKKVFDENSHNLWLSFAGGAVSGGLMGGGATFLGMVQNRNIEKLGKDIAGGKINGIDTHTLQNFDYKSEAAQEILNSDKLTYQDIGTLALIRNQEAVQAANVYIKQAVLEGKMPQRIADLYNKYEEYGLQSEVDGKIVNEQGVTFDEALEMFKYSGVIQNGNLIRQGLGAIVNASEAVNKTISEADAAFDKKVQAIQSNPVLSEQGKAQQIQQADQERMNAVNAAMQMQNEATQKAVPQNPVRAEAQMSANRRFTAQDANVNFNRSNLKVNAENRTVETKNGSLTYDFDGRNELSQMSKEQRAALDFSKYFAEKFGVNVNIAQHFVGNKVAENGAYDAKTNTIYIDLSKGTTNSLVYTAAHELTHWLKENNAQAFEDLKNAIKENLTRIDLASDELPDLYNLANTEEEGIMNAVSETDNLWDALIKYETQRYKEADMYHDAASIEEEVVCRCCESFLSREAFVREMAKQHFKSARSIMEFFNSLKEDIDTLRGAAKERVSFADESPENEFMQRYTEIERIAGLWSRIVNEAAEKNGLKAGDKWRVERQVENAKKKSLAVSDITEYERFDEAKYAKMSETERIEYREHLKEMELRKEARDRQREIDRNRRARSEFAKTLKKGNDRLVKLLSHPTDNAHVPVQLAQAVAEYAQRLNELLVADVNYVRDNPPSVEDVKAYIDEHGYNVDANRFVDFYTGRGWLANSGLPMTNWKLNVTSWAKRGAPQNVSGRQKTGAEKIIDALNRSYADEETIAQAKAENPSYDPRGLLPTSEYDETLVKMIQVMDGIVQSKHLNDLTTDELRLITNTMRGVIHAVTDANKLIGTNERKAIWKVGDQMVKEMESAPKVSDKLRGYLETSLDLRRIALIFSGSNENAEFVKLVNQLNDGAIEKERVAQVLQSIFKPVTDKYGEEIRTWYGKKAEWIDTGIEKNGAKIEITKGMRVALALHVLNEGNMRHIKNGGLTIPNREMYRKGNLADAYANGELVRLNAEQINEIISHMTEAEKAYVEAAKELFHKRTGYYVNKTSLALLGYRKAMVENYFPIHTDKNFTKTDFASLKMDGSIEGQGFLKERVNASNPVYLEDITSVVNRQIRGVALYAGLAVPMRNFNAVMNASVYEDDNGVWSPRTTVKETMTKEMGAYGAKVVEGFLADVSEMSHVDVTPIERFAGKLATNYVKAVLLVNLKVSMKQVASYPTAAAVIPWKYLNKALVAGGKNHRLISRADVDLIDQYTPLYKLRRESQANEIASIMQKQGLEQKLPALMGWITKMDVMTVGRLWSAAEYMVADQQKNLPVGSDEYYKAVAKVFNDCVQQTQPNFTPLQRNAALRSKNPIVRSLVLFGTQRMQNGGIIIENALALKQAQTPAAKQAARVKLGRAVASQIVQNIMLIAVTIGVDALRGRMKGWQDDDKEITAESLAFGMGDAFLSNMIGSFLGGSELYGLISSLYKKATGKTAYDTNFTVPALDAAETLINFVQNLPDVVKYITGDHTDEEKLKKAQNFSFDLAKAFGYATGIPLENAVKDLFKGFIPAWKDLRDAKKTGELIPWLHQSGKLDSKKTSERYKEWINSGRKGSEFFYWDNKMKGVTKRDDRIAILAAENIPNEEKAMLAAMFDTSGAYAEGTQLFRSNGNLYYDFADAKPASPVEQTLEDIAEATAAPTAAPTAEPTATPVPLSDKKMEGVQEAVKKGVPEELAVDAFLAYQDIGKQSNYDDDWSRNDQFREWLFKNVDDPNQRAILEYQVVGQATRVEGAVTYRATGTVYRDFTNEAWYELSGWNLASDGTNKRYEAGKLLEQTGMSVDKTVEIYRGLADYTKKAEWTQYMKEQGLTDEQIKIILWSRGWAKR